MRVNLGTQLNGPVEKAVFQGEWFSWFLSSITSVQDCSVSDTTELTCCGVLKT